MIDEFIEALKGDLRGIIFITSMMEGKDEIDDQDLVSENFMSRHITDDATSIRENRVLYRQVDRNLVDCMLNLEEENKDVHAFMKEERLRTTKKNKKKEQETYFIVYYHRI